MPPSLEGHYEDDALRSAVQRELQDQEAQARVEVRRRAFLQAAVELRASRRTYRSALWR